MPNGIGSGGGAKTGADSSPAGCVKERKGSISGKPTIEKVAAG
jgi:hypothetical protein